MGFNISVFKENSIPCPHCKGVVSVEKEELFYRQQDFFINYFWDNTILKKMEEALSLQENPERPYAQWSHLEGEGEEALQILKKIEHLINPKYYKEICKAVKVPGTKMTASW
jgi:hypothetical protein